MKNHGRGKSNFDMQVIQGDGKPQHRRWCYHILPDQFDENGFIPSMVTENQPGHQPFMGGEGGRPYYWGKSYMEANQVCNDANLNSLGITKEDRMQIVTSSMNSLRKVDPEMYEGQDQ